MKKIILNLLLVLFLGCFCAVSASAQLQGETGTANVIWSDSIKVTEAGQAVTYEIPGDTHIMFLDISSKADGEVLYISAHDNVELTVDLKIQQPADGWYCLDTATLHQYQISLTNKNMHAVTLTVKVPAPEPALFDIDAARMIMGNALEFQFGVAMSKFTTTEGYYAVIEKEWADGENTLKTIPASEWGVEGRYYAIVYDGLCAKEMGDTFYVTIYNADGVAVSNAKEDSVRAYVKRAFDGQDSIGKTMMVDMLNYGAAAQDYFRYGLDDLANSHLTDAQKAYATKTAPSMVDSAVKGQNCNASRFIFTSRIQVQVGFKNLTEDMYAIYTYTDQKGVHREIRVEGTDFVENSKGAKIGVELSKLVYSDVRTLVHITVCKADGTVHGTARDSIESCAARSTDDPIFAALVTFADSARVFLYG